ncbi:hypothetical protein EUGRSUZ_C00497 [Eucalyptus grandis]|uniref:Uncharacterized protein n=2 Tax=Eucalyptus grandis TaxID=71139 RepID=A0ACC3LA59_EUCGR|nr:hypothetical protein EUGRSUZ_C00497 [Eucalyptus grandis]
MTPEQNETSQGTQRGKAIVPTGHGASAIFYHWIERQLISAVQHISTKMVVIFYCSNHNKCKGHSDIFQFPFAKNKKRWSS